MDVLVLLVVSYMERVIWYACALARSKKKRTIYTKQTCTVVYVLVLIEYVPHRQLCILKSF